MSMKKRLPALAVMDLDGTLLRGKTSCEVLAESLGYLDRMRQFEALTLERDIASARGEMALWYKDIPLVELISSLQSATLAPKTHEGIDLLRQHSIEIAIVSITWEFIVEYFAKDFGINYYVGTRLTGNGQIIHFWPRNKSEWVRELSGNLGIPIKRVAAVGDSKGDVEMLKAVRYPVFVGKSLPTELEGVRHIPNGDIVSVAEWIIEAFGVVARI